MVPAGERYITTSLDGEKLACATGQVACRSATALLRGVKDATASTGLSVIRDTILRCM